MISKQNLLLGAGAVGLGVAGVSIYLTSSKTAKKEGDKEASTPTVVSCSSNPFGDVANVTIGVDGVEDGDNLEAALEGLKELDPSEACFSFIAAVYSGEESNKKLTSGKFEFSATKKEDEKSEGALVKIELTDSKNLSGVVVTLSKSKDSSTWTIEKGFGFSIENFDKNLKINSSTDTQGSFKWTKSESSSIFDLVKEGDSEYKPLFGVGIKDVAGVKVTKVYNKEGSAWKKVKESDNDGLKDKISNLVKNETKGTWTSSTAS